MAMSAGNHAQGLAFIAKKMNINSNIVMPEGTPFTKIRRTKNFGGNVIIHGSSLGESYEHVQKLINERGYTEVHPYNDLNVIAGQGTISYEMLSDCNDIDILLVPVGGGGLIAGCSLAAKAMNQNIKVIGIESELYPSLTNIMFNKKMKCKGSTLAEGIAVSEIGQVPLSFIKNFVDDVITVSDKSIERAIAMLAEHEKVVVEGIGLTLSVLTDSLRKQFNLKTSSKGLVIVAIDKDGPGAEKGLKIGDRVIEVSQKKVNTPRDVTNQITASRNAGRKSILLLVEGQSGLRFIALRLSKK